MIWLLFQSYSWCATQQNWWFWQCQPISHIYKQILILIYRSWFLYKATNFARFSKLLFTSLCHKQRIHVKEINQCRMTVYDSFMFGFIFTKCEWKDMCTWTGLRFQEMFQAFFSIFFGMILIQYFRRDAVIPGSRILTPAMRFGAAPDIGRESSSDASNVTDIGSGPGNRDPVTPFATTPLQSANQDVVWTDDLFDVSGLCQVPDCRIPFLAIHFSSCWFPNNHEFISNKRLALIANHQFLFFVSGFFFQIAKQTKPPKQWTQWTCSWRCWLLLLSAFQAERQSTDARSAPPDLQQLLGPNEARELGTPTSGMFSSFFDFSPKLKLILVNLTSRLIVLFF